MWDDSGVCMLGLTWREEHRSHLFVGHYLLCELVCPLLRCLRNAAKFIRPSCCISLQLHHHKNVLDERVPKQTLSGSCKTTTRQICLSSMPSDNPQNPPAPPQTFIRRQRRYDTAATCQHATAASVTSNTEHTASLQVAPQRAHLAIVLPDIVIVLIPAVLSGLLKLLRPRCALCGDLLRLQKGFSSKHCNRTEGHSEAELKPDLQAQTAYVSQAFTALPHSSDGHAPLKATRHTPCAINPLMHSIMWATLGNGDGEGKPHCLRG